MNEFVSSLRMAGFMLSIVSGPRKKSPVVLQRRGRKIRKRGKWTL